MFDAFGKPPPDGVFQGNLFKMGSYYSCLEVQNELFQGNYVYSTLQPMIGNTSTSIEFKIGLCFPDSCSKEEAQIVMNEMSQDFTSNTLKSSSDDRHEMDASDIGMVYVALSYV